MSVEQMLLTARRLIEVGNVPSAVELIIQILELQQKDIELRTDPRLFGESLR